MAPAYVFFASMLPLAVVSSAYLAPAVVRTPPPRAVVRMQKIEQKTAHVAQSEGAFAEAAAPAAFGVSSALNCDPDFLQAAKEAAEGAGLGHLSASEVVIAFNSWKLSLGRSYRTKEEEANDLRSFGSNLDLINQHLLAAESALINIDDPSYAPEDLTVELEAVNWRGVYDQASASRKAAEKAKAEAAAGTASADEKMRHAQSMTSKEEAAALAAAQARYEQDVGAAADDAARSRAKLAQQLAQVAVTEQEARALAQKRLTEEMSHAKHQSATTMTSAEADRKGALHKWQQTEEQADAALKAAEADMAYALAQAKEQEAAAKAAAEKRAAAALAAQSEAKALLEMLKQTQEKAAQDAQQAEAARREMEAAVEAATKRAQKAKLAAQAALDEL
jgi:hypothetical protein